MSLSPVIPPVSIRRVESSNGGGYKEGNMNRAYRRITVTIIKNRDGVGDDDDDDRGSVCVCRVGKIEIDR